jgi:predicted alpha/beta superfamily hydrolase
MLLTLFSILISACMSPKTQTQTTPSQVSLPGSELHSLTSTITRRDYDIYIRLPDEYNTEQQDLYPVLYVLDGQWDFKLLDSICGGLVYDKVMPKAIIAGITYSGDNPDYGALRAMDYTPVHDASISGSGGAPEFLNFFKQELIPFIEGNYRADPARRVLIGSSFGGSFSLFALFSEPQLFYGYVISSPAVSYGNRAAFTQEAEYASSHSDLPARVFISVGDAEWLYQPVDEFIQVINGRNYTGLEMATRIIEGEGHSGNKPESYNRGVRFIFAKK